MTQLVVYDAGALAALFHAHPVAYRYWRQADAGRRTLVFPAAAVAAANAILRATYDAWSTLIWPAEVGVAPLDSSAAVDVGLLSAALPTAHVVREARQVRGIVLTDQPNDYAGALVPLLVL